MKKNLSLLSVVVLLGAFVACNNNEPNKKEPQSQNSIDQNSDSVTDDANSDDQNSDAETDDTNSDDQNSDAETDDTNSDEYGDYTCPSADYYGCVENKDGKSVVLHCDGMTVSLVDECDTGKVCVPMKYGQYEVAYCDIPQAADLQKGCNGLDDDDYVCVTVGNDTWEVKCSGGRAEVRESTNCTANNMECGTVHYSGADHERCICTDDSQCKTTDVPNAVPACGPMKICDFKCLPGYDEGQDEDGYYCE